MICIFVAVSSNDSTEITTKDPFIEHNDKRQFRKEEENKNRFGECKSRKNHKMYLK